MNDALREVMLAAAGAGVLEGPDVAVGAAEHPVCGDLVKLYCRLRGDTILELGWQASGCPALMAVAAAAPVALQGARLAKAPSRLHARLQSLGGLARHEHHAERLVLTALERAGAGAGPALT